MIRFFQTAIPIGCMLVASNLCQSISSAQELLKNNFASELPRTPAKEPKEALAAIQVKDGFSLEIAAAEPLVRDPVAISFDENGRMFVVEMCDYSEQDDEFLGNVRMLEDADNDGSYEKSTLFAHHLSWPTGVICYDGGAFIAAAPDIWYCKDTDGDGRADIQNRIFTGFGRQNVQGLLNSFCWGLDNRIYCQTSSSGAKVLTPSMPERGELVLSGRDFSFDPMTLQLRPESGGGQHGMSFDDWGRRFACHNSDHLQLHVYADRYTAYNNTAPIPPSRQSIAADGPQASVYRISPVEPWRTVRTRLRVTNQVPGPVEGGGRSSGYFTSATGITIYRGNAFPKNMHGVAFVGDVGSNIVHRKKLTDAGVSMSGERFDIESEFIASSDIWFRPVQFANAPDGTLYIADLYREVIEHPKSLPEEIKQHLDLTNGRDRGRIYRVVPAQFNRPPTPQLANASLPELVTCLEHTNGWHRDTASRMLYERLIVHGDNKTKVDASRLLSRTVETSPSPLARLHALGVLMSIGAGQGGALRSLEDTHPRVREWAIRWSEENERITPETTKKLLALGDDPDPFVRFQLGLSLNQFHLAAKDQVAIAIRLLSGSQNDKWLNASGLNAIGSNAILALETLGAGQGGQGENLNQDRAGQGGPHRTMWRAIARLAGSQATLDQLVALDKQIENFPKDEFRRQLSIGLLNALQTRFIDPIVRNNTLAKLPTLQSDRASLVHDARAQCKNEQTSLDRKIESIELLRWELLDDDVEMLSGLLDQRVPQLVQEAATRALMQYQSAEVANRILSAWPSLSPRLRLTASDVILSRTSWIEMMLNRAGQGGFALTDLDPSRLANLRNHKDPKIKALVASAWKASDFGNRQEILNRYQASLSMSGDQLRGKQVFTKSCSACHRLESVGYELAPNIASYKFRGAEALLQNVIEPNREVNPQYVNYTVMTKDDRIVTGMVANESETSVTLLRGENLSEVLSRTDIAEMKSSKLSLMPEGLEGQIDLQSMADLIAYIAALP